ncbi:MAG: TMEM165/GDT1 family protein [Gammaproteobacteria bacterium]|nr:TMEM165/GDT1 family protein [Gammaproteobacteria bacterium]
MEHFTSISNINWLNVITTSSSSFLLIFAAEIGDKSQLARGIGSGL